MVACRKLATDSGLTCTCTWTISIGLSFPPYPTATQCWQTESLRVELRSGLRFDLTLILCSLHGNRDLTGSPASPQSYSPVLGFEAIRASCTPHWRGRDSQKNVDLTNW